MQHEVITDIDITYGNALAAGGGFHRVTQPDGTAAEIAPRTFLWFKTSSSHGSTRSQSTGSARSVSPVSSTSSRRTRNGSGSASSNTTLSVRGITHLRIGKHTLNDDDVTEWTKLDKCIDQSQGTYLWYQVGEAQANSSSSPVHNSMSMPLKDIKVTRTLDDMPEGYSHLQDPISVPNGPNDKNLVSYLCYQRLTREDMAASRWSVYSQKPGSWIEVRDLSSGMWHVALIVSFTTSDIHVRMSTWRANRDEDIPQASCTSRVAKLGTHTNMYLSSAYPKLRKEGSHWSIGSPDIEQAKRSFEKYFSDKRVKADMYASQRLVPFIERSMLNKLPSNEIAQEVHDFHAHVLKNVVASMLSFDAEAQDPTGPSESYLLAVLRLLLNGMATPLFFYKQYQSSATSSDLRLVYTSLLDTTDVISSFLSDRQPCRSAYYVSNVDLFFQAGGCKLLRSRMEMESISLTEVIIYCEFLHQAKPCLSEARRKSKERSSKRKTSPSSPTTAELESFFKEFLDAVLARLKSCSNDELKDEDGAVETIISSIDHIYRDGALLGEVDVTSSDDATEFSDWDRTFAQAVETFSLDHAKKLICCPFLSQRLLGISRVNDLIGMGQRHEEVMKKAAASKRRGATAALASSLTNHAASFAMSTSPSSTQPVAKWLTGDYIGHWLVDSDVLEVLLGDTHICKQYDLPDGAHVEVLKRCGNILEFIAARDYFTQRHLQLLWKASKGQLKSNRRAVMTVLSALCSKLQPELVDSLMNIITNVPVLEYDDVLIQFVRRVVCSAAKGVYDAVENGTSKRSLTSLVSAAAGGKSSKLSPTAQKEVELLNKVVNLGCCLLWNGTMDKSDASPVRPELKVEMEKALAGCLNYIRKLWHGSSSPHDQDQLQSHYVQECIENIKKHVCVVPSMRLIERVGDSFDSTTPGRMLSRAASFSSSSGASMSLGRWLKDLDSKHHLIGVSLDDVESFVEASTDASNPRDMLDRLIFITFVIKQSDLELSYADLSRLWKCFSDPKVTHDMREAFFQWVCDVLPNPNVMLERSRSGVKAMGFHVVTDLFKSITTDGQKRHKSDVVTFDPKTMGKYSFRCFDYLFRLVNLYEKHMSLRDASANDSRYEKPHVVIESMHLKGLETLYEILLASKDDFVTEAVVDYIVFLHMNVGSKLVRKEVWIDFVKDWFTRIERHKTLATDDEKTATQRLLLLLSTFLYQSTSHSSNSGTTGSGMEELVVNVRKLDSTNVAQYRYRFRRTALVSQLRERVAKDTGYPGDRIRLINEVKTKLTAQGHGKFTLEKARVFGTTTSAKSPVNSGKVKHQVDAVILSRPEGDTAGHVSPDDKTGMGGSSMSILSDWDAMKMEVSEKEDEHHVLLHLLATDTDICDEAWKILRLLPPVESIGSALRTLDGTLLSDGRVSTSASSHHVKWRQLLDSEHASKLLYQMEQLEQIALGGVDETNVSTVVSVEHLDDLSLDQVEAPTGQSSTWCESFITLGGESHLKSIFMAWKPSDMVTNGALCMMAVTKLLKLLNYFAIIRKHVKDLEPNDDVGTLVKQIIELLSSLQTERDSQEIVDTESDESAAKVRQRPLWYARASIEDPSSSSEQPSWSHLMSRALSLLSTCLISSAHPSPSLLESHPSYQKVLTKCLVDYEYTAVRRETSYLILSLCSRVNMEEDRQRCCSLFLTMLSAFDDDVQSKEFYSTYKQLIGTVETLEAFDFISACRILCRRIKSFEPAEEASVDHSKSSNSSMRRELRDALLKILLETLLALVQAIPPILAADNRHGLREHVATCLHEDEGIFEELFHYCLFATPEAERKESDQETSQWPSASSQFYLQQPKCRSEASREVAFQLLLELTTDNISGLRYLFIQMAHQHSLTPLPEITRASSTATLTRKSSSGKELSSSRQTAERGKYVGLKNLGCTCYLNSTIQAFFMIPRFRRHILRSQTVANGGKDRPSALYELQSLFAHLEGSAKPYYNPRALISATVTSDGGQIDVNEQKDASEFLTEFFQQLESEMNGASAQSLDDENLLNTYFGGVFSNELVADGGKYSERLEPFHFISVPVRDQGTLQESLTTWAKGDMVSYTWDASDDEEEKKTLDTQKRISIAKLPEYLIIHLKRFEYDLERWQQIKLHDRFEFPMDLDMYAYTKEGQQEQRRSSSISDSNHPEWESTTSRTTAPEYSQYELKGTVVHMGSANSGHYYSFLREDNTSNWFEFNDTVVAPFDSRRIPEECFGGRSSVQPAPGQAPRMKTRSSFLLFYSRKQPKLHLSKSPSTKNLKMYSSALALLCCIRLKRKAQERLRKLRLQTLAPEGIRDQIARENRVFWRKKYLYNARNLQFTYDLLHSCLHSPHSISIGKSGTVQFEPIEVRYEALQVAIKFVFGTLWQTGNVEQMVEWKPLLKQLVQDEVDGCIWALSTLQREESLLLDLLIMSENSQVRELTADVLSVALLSVSSFEYENQSSMYGPPEETKRDPHHVPASFEFVLAIVQVMPAVLRVPVKQHKEFFFLLYQFAHAGRNESIFLVGHSVVGAIAALATGKGSSHPLLQAQMKKHKDQQLLKSIDLDPTILRLLSMLVRLAKPPAMDSKDTHLPPRIAHDPAELTEVDRSMLLNDRFVMILTQRAERYNKETKPLQQLVYHLCWESQRLTLAFFEKIFSGIEVEDHYDLKPYFRTLNALFKIKDSLAPWRVSEALKEVLRIMGSQQRYYKATEVSIDMLTRLAKRHSGVRKWMQSHLSQCSWMIQWMEGHQAPDGLLQRKKTVLVKPNSTSSWANVNASTESVVRSVSRSMSKLLPRLRNVLDGESEVDMFYDSDDNPMQLVNKRVRVKWAKENYYEGLVTRFDESTYEHHVSYDDGDERKYRMAEKIFYIVDSGVASTGSSI